MRSWIARRPVTALVALTVLLTWAAWLPLLAQTQGWVETSPWSALHLFGSLLWRGTFLDQFRGDVILGGCGRWPASPSGTWPRS